MKLAGLHVAFVHDFLGLGGAEVVSRQTGALFAKLGIHTHYYCTEHRTAEWTLPDAEHCSITLLPETKKLWTKGNLAFLLEDAKKQGVKVLFIPVSSRCKLWPELRASGLKLVYWLHTAPFDEVPSILRTMEERSRRSPLRRLEWLAFKRPWEEFLGATRRRIHNRYRHILSHVDRFITLCPAYSREIIETLGLSGAEAEKLTAIQNTIPLPAPELIQVKKARKIIYMGRLDPIAKRVSRLVEVWHQLHHELPDWEVEIYGTGSEQPRLEELIQSLRLPRITLRGYCAEPSAVYQQAAIVALTSQHEGWPMVLLEAQSYGCVPIAFDCSAGVRAVIGEAPSCGMLIPPYSLAQYAEELRLLCQEESLRQDLQSACLLKSLTYAHSQNEPVWQDFFAQLIPSA